MKSLYFVVLIVALCAHNDVFGQRHRGGDDELGLCLGPCGGHMDVHFGPGMGDRHGRGEALMDALEDLDLSNEQIDKIKSIRDNAYKLSIPLRGEIEVKQAEIRELMNGEKPDKDKVSAKIKELESIRSQLHINRSNAHIDMLNILTKEQRDKMEKRMFERGGFGKKRMKRFFED